MNSDLEGRLKREIGPDHFVDLRVRAETNADGLDVVWIDVVYRDLADGPDLNTMSRVVDEAWDALASEDVTPIVSFVSIEEDRPLAAAE